jgi:hypothetical protein
MSWLFDGEHEISVGLEERGRSFGLSCDQYGSLAHVSMGALRMAGVEPSVIRLLRNGEPGADVILYGKNWVYTVRMQPLLGRSSLYTLPLDSKLGGPGAGPLYVHEFRDTDYVGGILATILQNEGVPLMDCQEAAEYVRAQQLKNPPRPRRIWE